MLAVALAASSCQGVLPDYGVTPDVSCGPLSVLEGGECVRAGVRDCGSGFAPSENGTCTPLLYEGPCQRAGFKVLGTSSCSSLGFADCPAARYPAASATDRVTFHVGSGPVGGEDGSPDRPFASIDAALANTDGHVTLLLERGSSYLTNTVVEGRRVRIAGTCAKEAELRGSSDTAVLQFGPGSDGSRIEGIAIRGGGDGIRVTGARDISISGVWLHDTGEHAVTVDDSSGPSSALLERSLVEKATDVAVSVYGGALTVRETEIRDVSPRQSNGRALGLVARPSRALASDLRMAMRRPASLCVLRSVIHGCRGSGIFAEESNLDVRESVIHDIEAAPHEAARGIHIRAQPAQSLSPDGADALPTECTSDDETPLGLDVRKSVIEGVQNVGIGVWNAAALVEDTVIRNISGSSEQRCLGNGIRARRDLVRDFVSEPRIEVRRSVVQATAQAGIHVDGESLNVEDSVIRDSGRQGCGQSGDGVVVLQGITGTGGATIHRSWIEGSSGAAVVSRGAEVALRSTVLACNAAPSLAGGIAAEGVSCECNGRQTPCGEPSAERVSGLIGGGGCDARDATACFRVSLGAMNIFQSALGDVTVWSHDHDDVASRLSGVDGRVELEGLPLGKPTIAAGTHETTYPGLAMVAPLASDSPSTPRILMPRLVSADANENILGIIFDARKGLVVAVRVCRAPKEVSPHREACEGLPGVVARLDPGPSGPAVYTDDSDVPDPTLRATRGPHVVFPNVAAGVHTVHLSAVDGARLRCHVEPGGLGWPTGAPDAFDVFVEESFMILGAELVCQKES